MKKLRINTDSKCLVSNVNEWIPTWKENEWKTSENNSVKNRTQYEKLKKALEPIQVILNHVRSHSGIKGMKQPTSWHVEV